jgi:hypothetical protein
VPSSALGLWFDTLRDFKGFRFSTSGVGDTSVWTDAHSPSNDSNPVSYSVSLMGCDAEGGESLVYVSFAQTPFGAFFLLVEGTRFLAFCDADWDLDRTGVSTSPSEEMLSQAVWKDSARDDDDRCTV